MLSHSSTLPMIARLVEPAQRREAARQLARQLGAEELIVFIPDAEMGVLLPAPGFPQTLPRGRQWRAFLALCATASEHTALLPFPGVETPRPALGLAEAGSVLVLFGGQPQATAVRELCGLLPLLAAVFRAEQRAALAEGRAATVDEIAATSQALALSLDAARRELQDALDQVTATLRMRDEFLAAVSHDLRSPPATLQGMAQLLRRQASKSSAPETARLVAGLETMELTTRKMAGMVRELLDLSQLDAGQPLELTRRQMDLGALVRDAVRDAQHTTSRHTLRVEAPAEAMVGEWDRERLERVLSNLLSNAVKYSPDGGAITVALADEETDGERWAVLTVADQGLGIAADDLPHIFERFFRAASVSGRIQGTGIGLAGAKHIVEQHGGSLTVTSEPGRGSRFSVRLPWARADGDGC